MTRGVLLLLVFGLCGLFLADTWRLASDSSLVFIQPRPGIHRGRDPLYIQLKRTPDKDDRRLDVMWGCDGLEAGAFQVQIDDLNKDDALLPWPPRKVFMDQACETEFVAALVSVKGGKYHARAIVRQVVIVQ